MMHEFLDLLETIAVSLGLDIAAKKFSGKGVEEATKIIKKKLTDEHRSELLAYICGLYAYSPVASENLLRRHIHRQMQMPRSYGNYEKYEPGDENRFVTLLSKLYFALDDEHEKNIRIQTFEWLGQDMTDEEFDAALEFLHHDVVIQYIKKFFWIVKIGWNKFYSDDPSNPGAWQKGKAHVVESHGKADKKFASKIWQIDRWLDGKGVK